MKNAARTMLLLLVGACHGAAGAAPTSEARTGADRLYPLRAGSVWSYGVETGEGGPPTLAITRVTSSGDGRAEVSSSGGPPVRYEQREDGLYRSDRGAYLLKLPLRQGASWDAGQGVTAEVVGTDKSVTTPAGSFTGCVEVRESGGPTPKVVRTVFCPDVGPVEVESTVPLAVAGRSARVVARLLGYDFSGALTAP